MRENAEDGPPEGVQQLKKKEEVIIVDTLLEDGKHGSDLPHLCLDRHLIENSGHSALDPKGLEDVLACVRKSKRKINRLSLMFNKTQAQGVGNFLKTDRSITEVCILCEGTTPQSIDAVAQALRENDNVRKVLLGGRELGEEAALSLGGVLQVTRSLEELTLFHCSLGDQGVMNISEGLGANDTLRYLDLNYCSMGDEGAKQLGRSLRSHPKLSCLNLRGNLIGEQGAEQLAAALRFCPLLSELHLGCNLVGNRGAAALANALMLNKSIKSLGLSMNKVTDEGGIAFAVALGMNSTIRLLNLRRNNLSFGACERIRAGWNSRNAKESIGRGIPWHDGLYLPME
ncbi:unnamed protein product [Discosporangium mesarthrocarpum]